ncbi:MAG: hypothetical protein ABSG31_00295 [Tepidisphaeraceae bacterium]|jgi:hypothetical protein
MYDKGRIIWINNVNDLNKPVADTATDHQPFSPADLARKTAPGIPHYRLYFFDSAPVLSGMLAIPIIPPELRWSHYITI